MVIFLEIQSSGVPKHIGLYEYIIQSINSFLQGTYAIPKSQGESSKAGETITSSPGPTKIKAKEHSSATSANDDSLIDDDEESMDWWTKYFASVDAMIDVRMQTISYSVLETQSVKFQSLPGACVIEK